MKKSPILAVLAACALLGSSAILVPQALAVAGYRAPEKEDDEETIKLTDAPAAVQAAIAKFSTPAGVVKVTKEEEDGVVTYEADFNSNGSEGSVTLSAAGDVLEVEKVVSGNTLPAAASEALKKSLGGATVGKYILVQKTMYEVEVTEGGKTREIKVDGAGHIKDSKMEKEDDDEKDEKGEKHEKHEKGEKK